MIHIIVAFTHKTFGIGKNNTIPWNIKEDLYHFRNITQGGIVVMGRKTWESIPLNNKPLKNRRILVLTNQNTYQYSTIDYDNVEYVNYEELNIIIKSFKNVNKDIYIIGGTYLFQEYMGIADKLHVTIINKEYKCDTFFPIENFHKYRIESYSAEMYSNEEECTYCHITYVKNSNSKLHDEYKYLYLLHEIIKNGESRPDRTGIGTKSIFGKQLHFDISNQIPIITTKFVPWKLVVKELLWFLKGQTNSKILESQGVFIWKGNSSREFLNNRNLTEYEEGDIGPMYGFNWRHFNAEYKGCHYNYEGKGYDQLHNVIENIKIDPYSRRHMITTFNPCVLEQSALAPCHGIVTQFYVSNDENNEPKYLSCHMYQRSSDTALGLVINITSYSILTHIICKLCDLKPKELIISTGDTHIYSNHIEKVKEQLQRNPFPFPKLHINNDIINKKIEDIVLDDFQLIGYLHHPGIQLPMAV